MAIVKENHELQEVDTGERIEVDAGVRIKVDRDGMKVDGEKRIEISVLEGLEDEGGSQEDKEYASHGHEGDEPQEMEDDGDEDEDKKYVKSRVKKKGRYYIQK